MIFKPSNENQTDQILCFSKLKIDLKRKKLPLSNEI